MPHVVGKLAGHGENVLARDHLLDARAGQLLEAAGDSVKAHFDLGGKEEAGLEDLGGLVRHDAVSDIKAAEEYCACGEDFDGELEEASSAEKLVGVEVDELQLVLGSKELWQLSHFRWPILKVPYLL